MKQSTKLLSLLLAVIIAFSCMSVIGSAVLVPEEISYDSIDDFRVLSHNNWSLLTNIAVKLYRFTSRL